MITWIISDWFTSEIVCVGSMERNSKMVISPLGATNNNGCKGSLESLSCIVRKMKIKNTIAKAQINVSAFNTSLVSIK